MSVSTSITDLYSAESWSISTALCVLSGNDETDSSSVIVWNCCCWTLGCGDCPVVSSRPSDQFFYLCHISNEYLLFNFFWNNSIKNKPISLISDTQKIPHRYINVLTSAVVWPHYTEQCNMCFFNIIFTCFLHHPLQRAVLSQISCFREHKVVLFQILLNGAEPCDVGTTSLSSPVCQRGG